MTERIPTHRCKVCGCKHYEMKAEPGKIFGKGA